jgi:hypothetical protein
MGGKRLLQHFLNFFRWVWAVRVHFAAGQNVTLKTLEQLSDWLHCKISDLFGEEP